MKKSRARRKGGAGFRDDYQKEPGTYKEGNAASHGRYKAAERMDQEMDKQDACEDNKGSVLPDMQTVS